MIRLKRRDAEKIVLHARACLPEEACGLIGGTVTADGDKNVEAVFPLTNADHSPEHFSMDPREQVAAIREMRALGLTPLGNFHSHPETPARPSGEDKRLAFDSAAVYMILSLAGEAPVLRAFHIEHGTAEEETLVITEE